MKKLIAIFSIGLFFALSCALSIHAAEPDSSSAIVITKIDGETGEMVPPVELTAEEIPVLQQLAQEFQNLAMIYMIQSVLLTILIVLIVWYLVHESRSRRETNKEKPGQE